LNASHLSYKLIISHVKQKQNKNKKTKVFKSCAKTVELSYFF